MRSVFLGVFPAVVHRLPTAAAADACTTSGWEIDVEYHNGPILGNAKGDSAADCCLQCSKFAGCKYFTYALDDVGSECTFNEFNLKKRNRTGVVSGPTGVNPPPVPTPPPVPPPPPAPLPPPEDPLVVPVDRPVTVWAAVDTLHKCGSIDVPDVPPRLFQDGDGLTHMIVGAPEFHVMTGPSPFNLSRSCSVAWNGTIRNPDPSKFAFSEFLNSAIAFENGTVVSLLDDEYYECPVGVTYPYCYWLSLNLAVSHDWGYTWQHAREPPNHLVAVTPYKYNASWLASGWGAPTNIVRNPKDGFYYVGVWNKHQAGLQDQGTCFMRTNNLMDPSSWRSWSGSEWNITFVSPYTMEPGTEADHICAVTSLRPECNACGLVWSAYLEKFVTTMYCLDTPDHYLIATSEDLIHWSEAELFYTKNDMPADVANMVTQMFYPTLVDPNAPTAFSDRNYYTIGQDPYLYWVSIGHSPYTDGRRVWAQKLHFKKGTSARLEALV